ncbi:MAG: hypothetical protein KDB37_18735 [Ilumatobacter sp.]|nr:hypothetical protein [Ilumatobacter sp.]
MKRTSVSVAAIAAALVAVAGCSSDDIAESIAERAIEANGDGDVDIDLDDGEFSVETEDGSFQMTTDEDGNVVIQAQDAEGNDVFSSQTEDGVTQIQTEDGDATITQSGDGDESEMVIETEDGTATFSQSGDLPEDFPEIPLPDDLTVVMSQQSDTGDGQTNVVVGTAPGDWESYLDELTAFLDDNGYVQQSLTTTQEGAFFMYTDAGETMSISGGVGTDPSSGGMSINLVIGPN